MRYSLILFFFPLASAVQAQQQYFDVNSNNSMVRFFDPARARQPEETTGTCYWKEDWSPALLILKDGRRAKIKSVKLNFYTSEVYFQMMDGKEAVAKNTILKSLTFLDTKDTSKIVAHFEVLSLDFKTKDSYYQVLNSGKAQLLKHTKIVLHKSDYDPLRGKTDMSYDSEIEYVIKHEDTFSRLKALNKSSILPVLRSSSDIDRWLADNKNKLKNESDVIAFLSYYNTLK